MGSVTDKPNDARQIDGQMRRAIEHKKDMKEEGTDIAIQKRIIRKNVLAIRDSILASDKEQYDARIRTAVTDMREYREAQSILAYASYQSEVDTSVLIKQALTDGKHVFVPKVSGTEMEFWQITASEDLQEGYRGIPEPKESISFPEWAEKRLDTENVCEAKDGSVDVSSENGRRRVVKVMMWMPGAVFDQERNRIGYGRGFYDRYLNRLSSWEKEICAYHEDKEIQLITAALAYHCQILERIPCETHDIRPDMVITEKGRIENEIFRDVRTECRGGEI